MNLKRDILQIISGAIILSLFVQLGMLGQTKGMLQNIIASIVMMVVVRIISRILS